MGEVFLCFSKADCSRVAIKKINRKKLSVGGTTSVDNSRTVYKEIAILRELNHPCIVHIFSVVTTVDMAYLVLEIVEGGELFDRIIENRRLSEKIAKLYSYQMCLAIKYLHDNGVTHRDLKPENILLASQKEETLVKVTDFGLSKVVDSQSLLKTYCGTPNYLPPEIVKANAIGGTYTLAVDVWSLGVIFFVCLSGNPPFAKEYGDLNDQILKGRYKFHKESWNDVSTPAIELVKAMLTVNPQRRISMKEALADPWFQDDDMKNLAHRLMYPNADGMMPPAIMRSPAKKRIREALNQMTTETDQSDNLANSPMDTTQAISEATPPPQKRRML